MSFHSGPGYGGFGGGGGFLGGNWGGWLRSRLGELFDSGASLLENRFGSSPTPSDPTPTPTPTQPRQKGLLRRAVFGVPVFLWLLALFVYYQSQ